MPPSNFRDSESGSRTDNVEQRPAGYSQIGFGPSWIVITHRCALLADQRFAVVASQVGLGSTRRGRSLPNRSLHPSGFSVLWGHGQILSNNSFRRFGWRML